MSKRRQMRTEKKHRETIANLKREIEIRDGSKARPALQAQVKALTSERDKLKDQVAELTAKIAKLEEQAA